MRAMILGMKHMEKMGQRIPFLGQGEGGKLESKMGMALKNPNIEKETVSRERTLRKRREIMSIHFLARIS